MRVLFISDIHGHYYPMEKLLKEANFKPGVDILVVGGDMIDRGPDSGKVLKRIRSLKDKYPNHITVIQGNHEQMMDDCINHKWRRWMIFGGVQSMDSFDEEFSEEELKDYTNWVSALPLVVETDKFIFTHAGINPSHPLNAQKRNVAEQSFEDLYNIDKDILLEFTGGRPIIHGHVPVESIMSDGIRINCDLGMSVLPYSDARLALVDLTNFSYFAYSQQTKEITEEQIIQISGKRSLNL